jgi:hypothetical protein
LYPAQNWFTNKTKEFGPANSIAKNNAKDDENTTLYVLYICPMTGASARCKNLQNLPVNVRECVISLGILWKTHADQKPPPKKKRRSIE